MASRDSKINQPVLPILLVYLIKRPYVGVRARVGPRIELTSRSFYARSTWLVYRECFYITSYF